MDSSSLAFKVLLYNWFFIFFYIKSAHYVENERKGMYNTSINSLAGDYHRFE